MRNSYMSILNPKMGEEEIESFSETPAEETSVEELDKAEEQIAEEETETTLDYATPGSIEDPSCVGGSCPSCDAGDVAIIDAELAPADGESGDDLAEDEEVDFSADLKLYQRIDHKLTHSPFVACESFSDVIGSLIGALKSITMKIAKYTNRVYKFSRNKIAATHLRLQTVYALWNRKLSKNLSDVDADRLNELEVEAFPYDVWIDAAKISLAAFEMVHAAERVVFDPGDTAVTNSMDRFADKLKQLGISINIPQNRINVDSLLDTRKFESISSLGYSKSQVPNCLRYFGDIAKRVPKGDLNTLEATTTKVINRLTQFAASINTAVDEGRLKKDSKEYREEVDKLLHYTVRYDFILTCMKCSYFLFDKLSADILHIFQKYEDAMTDPEYI